MFQGIVMQKIFDNDLAKVNGFLVVSIIIAAVSIVIIVVLFIWHIKIREPEMTNKDEFLHEKRRSYDKFDHKYWANEECDRHFMKFFDSGKIKASKSLRKVDEKDTEFLTV